MKLYLLLLLLPFRSTCFYSESRPLYNTFSEIVRQKTRGNEIRQCPCVLHPESKQCISYDSRYVAVNYEEAILSFLDLSKHDYPAPLINSNTFKCTRPECQHCFSLLYHKLTDIGFIPPEYRPAINLISRNNVQSNLCPRFNFPFSLQTPQTPTNVPSYVSSLIVAGRNYHHNVAAVSSSAAVTSSSRNIIKSNNGNGNQANRNNHVSQQAVVKNEKNARQQQQQQQQQQSRIQFRNNQAIRNRFNEQQRVNLRNNNFPQNNPSRVGSNPAFVPANISPGQRWNGQFWEPIRNVVTEGIRQPIRNVIQNRWNQQNSNNPWSNQNKGVKPGWNNGRGPTGNNGIVPNGGNDVTNIWNNNGRLPGNNGVGPNWNNGNNGGPRGNNGIGWGASNGGPSLRPNQWPSGFVGGFKQRNKRETNIIGQRFVINCIERGESEDDMLALCGSCWTWRQLPDGYFPRIINELSCKEDDFCLSGWGECIQQYRNVDVLRRENGRWIPTVITTATCCDCRVRAGTEIHSLVIGDKK